jgi:hypothetical protein
MTPKIEKEGITAPTAVKKGPPWGKFKEKHQYRNRPYYTVPSITAVLMTYCRGLRSLMAVNC